MSSLKNRWLIKVKYSSFRKHKNWCSMLITQWLGWLHCFWYSKTTPLSQSTSWVAAFIRSLLTEVHVVPLGFFICNLPVPLDAKDQPALGKEALNTVKKTSLDMGTFIQPSVRTRLLWPDPDHITCEQLHKNQGYCLAIFTPVGKGGPGVPWSRTWGALLGSHCGAGGLSSSGQASPGAGSTRTALLKVFQSLVS